MNNSIYPMNSVSFQARLDLSKVKGSKQRWQNIARMFEEKTKKYSKEVVALDGSFKKGLDLNFLHYGLASLDEVCINPNAAAKLKASSDKEIVKNIVDIFNHLIKERANMVKENKLAEILKLDVLDNKHKTNFQEAFYDLMTSIRAAKEKDFVKDHPVFHNGGLIF